jgi:hypothetical protein
MPNMPNGNFRMHYDKMSSMPRRVLSLEVQNNNIPSSYINTEKYIKKYIKKNFMGER